MSIPEQRKKVFTMENLALHNTYGLKKNSTGYLEGCRFLLEAPAQSSQDRCQSKLIEVGPPFLRLV